MSRRRTVQRRRLTGRRKADKRQHIGSSHAAGTEAGIWDAEIARISKPEQADELIRHLENEMKKTKSVALRRRLEVAIASTKVWKAQLQQHMTTTGAEKTRPQKPQQLYMGLDRLLTDNRPLATPPPTREDEEDDEPSYE